MYQRFLFVMLMVFCFFLTFVYFTQLFLIVVPDEFWCEIPTVEGFTSEELRDYMIPTSNLVPYEGHDLPYSRCWIYDIPVKIAIEAKEPDPKWPMKKCHEWYFKTSPFDVPYISVASEFGWVTLSLSLSFSVNKFPSSWSNNNNEYIDVNFNFPGLRRRVQSVACAEYIFRRFHPWRFDIRLAWRQIRKDSCRCCVQSVGIHRRPRHHIHPHVLAILRVQVHRRRVLRQHLRVRLHISPGIRGPWLAYVRRPRLFRLVLHVRRDMHAVDGLFHS